MQYIISCSGEKRNLSTLQTTQSQLVEITGFKDLFDARLTLINRLGISNELDWSNTVPAYQLYFGKLYKKVLKENWIKQNTDIVIVSALFGLLRPTDLIPNYNIVMDQKIPDTGEKIHQFWFEQKINQYILPENAIDLLFSKYRLAFNKNGREIGKSPDITWRDKYGSHKGEWLNEQLNTY